MVKRKESGGFDRFEGIIEDIKLEPSQLNPEDQTMQYHLYIKPTNVEVKGKTGLMHEWIRLSQTTTDDTIPEGSILDRYITEIETVIPETKKIETHTEVFLQLKGKKFLFTKKKLGKAYEGKEAKEYWVPIAKL